jgi:hypothetical protein
MAIHLQSVADPTLYFNGSTLEDKGTTLAMFDPITNARDFISVDEANQVAETIDVPVVVVVV